MTSAQRATSQPWAYVFICTVSFTPTSLTVTINRQLKKFLLKSSYLRALFLSLINFRRSPWFTPVLPSLQILSRCRILSNNQTPRKSFLRNTIALLLLLLSCAWHLSWISNHPGLTVNDLTLSANISSPVCVCVCTAREFCKAVSVAKHYIPADQPLTLGSGDRTWH